MKIGVFGGCFNPVHHGHLAVAEAARPAFFLERVFFVPAWEPTHREREALAPYADRLAMLQLALAGHSWAEISEVEARRGGKSYTIDTLRELRQQFPSPCELYLILGGDSLAALPTWKEFSRLFEYARVLCYPRGEARPQIPGALAAALSPEQRRQLEEGFLPGSLMPISSSQIRQAWRNRESVARWLPSPVVEYMTRHRLYQGA